jgi:hypothetical protein
MPQIYEHIEVVFRNRKGEVRIAPVGDDRWLVRTRMSEGSSSRPVALLLRGGGWLQSYPTPEAAEDAGLHYLRTGELLDPEVRAKGAVATERAGSAAAARAVAASILPPLKDFYLDAATEGAEVHQTACAGLTAVARGLSRSIPAFDVCAFLRDCGMSDFRAGQAAVRIAREGYGSTTASEV